MIAQKYRLHSQVHSNTNQSPTREVVLEKEHNVHDVPENSTEDCDSDNSDDSGNLVIKEDTEEDTDQYEKESKNILSTENKPRDCSEEKNEVKPEPTVENNDIKDEKKEEGAEAKSENCPPPPSTCEVIIYLAIEYSNHLYLMLFLCL